MINPSVLLILTVVVGSKNGTSKFHVLAVDIAPPNTTMNLCVIMERDSARVAVNYDRLAAAIDLALTYVEEEVLFHTGVALRMTYRDGGRVCDNNHIAAMAAMKLWTDGIHCDAYLGPGQSLNIPWKTMDHSMIKIDSKLAQKWGVFSCVFDVKFWWVLMGFDAVTCCRTRLALVRNISYCNGSVLVCFGCEILMGFDGFWWVLMQLHVAERDWLWSGIFHIVMGVFLCVLDVKFWWVLMGFDGFWCRMMLQNETGFGQEYFIL